MTNRCVNKPQPGPRNLAKGFLPPDGDRHRFGRRGTRTNGLWFKPVALKQAQEGIA